MYIYGPTLRTDTQKDGRGLPQGKNIEEFAKLEEHQPFYPHICFLTHQGLPLISDRELLCFKPAQQNLTWS